MNEARIYRQPCYSPVGDCAMLIELGHGIDETLNERVLQLEAQLHKLALQGVEETTPAYCSLLLHYNPDLISFEALQETVSAIDPGQLEARPSHFLWHVPVCYGGAYGADLDSVANYHHLSTDEVIRLHSAPRYRVYLIGFAPGYTYLGGLDKNLHTPRRENPRLQTPAGSISVGGMQALIAGVAMPSGWQLLGQTPLATYDPRREPHFLIAPGDAVEFYPIDPAEFERLRAAAERGDWLAERTVLHD